MIKRKFLTDVSDAFISIEGFKALYGIEFTYADMAVSSGMGHVVELFGDLRSMNHRNKNPKRHHLSELCEVMVIIWKDWVDRGQPEEDNPFDSQCREILKEESGLGVGRVC